MLQEEVRRENQWAMSQPSGSSCMPRRFFLLGCCAMSCFVNSESLSIAQRVLHRHLSLLSSRVLQSGSVMCSLNEGTLLMSCLSARQQSPLTVQGRTPTWYTTDDRMSCRWQLSTGNSLVLQSGTMVPRVLPGVVTDMSEQLAPSCFTHDQTTLCCAGFALPVANQFRTEDR